MKIFKFGGASVKDAEGVKNLVKILEKVGKDQTLIVVSAMGKTTNSLELVVKNYFENKEELSYSINQIYDFHNNIYRCLRRKHQFLNYNFDNAWLCISFCF